MRKAEHLEVLALIEEIRNSHSEMINIFLFGSCINLYSILKVVYKDARAYYDVNHIITEIGGKYYDINGEVEHIGNYLPFESYYNKEQTERAFRQMYDGEHKIKHTEKGD